MIFMVKQFIKAWMYYGGVIMYKNRMFCKHIYYFAADFQRTPAKSKKTTHYISLRCAKCHKEKKLTPFITVLDEQ